MSPQQRLAVLGSPIAHSKSPALHAAAYRELGVDWEYTAVDVGSGELVDFIAALDSSWRGLSLTMPLKREVGPLLTDRDGPANLTGVANTVLFDGAGPGRRIHGFNTDVYGITAALEHAGLVSADIVHILGGGATAASALVAAAQLGATKVRISTRNPLRTDDLVQLGNTLGIELVLDLLNDPQPSPEKIDLVVSTLPNGAEATIDFSQWSLADSALLDVAYHPWPSPFATQWVSTGGLVVSGLEMLVHQALAQVRVFVGGSAETLLAEEERILEAMLASVGLSRRS